MRSSVLATLMMLGAAVPAATPAQAWHDEGHAYAARAAVEALKRPPGSPPDYAASPFILCLMPDKNGFTSFSVGFHPAGLS